MASSRRGGLIAIVSKAWQGKEDLWVVYWFYGHLVLPVAALPLALLPPYRFLIGFSIAVLSTYYVWWAIVVWRCAFKCQRKIWAYVGRVGILYPCLFLVEELY